MIAGATPTPLAAHNFESSGPAMAKDLGWVPLMRTKAGNRPKIAPAGHVRQALDERARRMDPIPWGEDPIGVSWDYNGREVWSRGANEIAVPAWDGLDPAEWPDVRTQILRWATLTRTPIEEQGDTLVARMTGRAELALTVYEPGDLLLYDGVEVVLGTSDEYRLEAAVFFDPRRSKETLLDDVMRLQSAHDELAKMRPGCLDDTMRG